MTGANLCAAHVTTPARADDIEAPDTVTPEMFGARRGDPGHDSANAIADAFATGRPVRFGQGTYYVGRSVMPGRRNARAHFDDTTIRIKEGVPYEAFTECLGWDGLSLRGRHPRGNLPAMTEGVRVLFDLSASRYSRYTGQLELKGNRNFPALAILASANAARTEGGQAGGGGSIWDCNLVLSFGAYGLFGTPRFNAPSNQYYPDPFAGSVFSRVRIHNCTAPILAGANTLDDAFFSVLHLALRDGDRGYLYTTALNAGSIFMRCNGNAGTAVGLDVQESTVCANTLYAENSFDAPIHLREGGWINGVLRHGAGRRSVFTKGCMVYSDAREAGGTVTAHERCRDSRGMQALVKLRATNRGEARTFVVHQPYPESEKAAFAFEDGGRGPGRNGDALVCLAPGGPIEASYRDGRLLRYRRRSGTAPFEPLSDAAAGTTLPSYQASYGALVISTSSTTGETLFTRYGALEDTGFPVIYTDFRIDARRPHRLSLTAPEADELGRRIGLSARNADVTIVHDAACRLSGNRDRVLTRDGNERVGLIATEYWDGTGHRRGWLETAV